MQAGHFQGPQVEIIFYIYSYFRNIKVDKQAYGWEYWVFHKHYTCILVLPLGCSASELNRSFQDEKEGVSALNHSTMAATRDLLRGVYS